MDRHTERYAGPPGPGGQARPDFVLLGLPVPGGVELWASTELDHAELEAQMPRTDIYWGADDLFVPPTVYTLHAGLRRFVVVRAPDYRAALASLLSREDWQPGTGPLAIG